MSSYQAPIRYPDSSNSKEMTFRGWLLLVFNFIFPGSAQLLAGNKKLGRIGSWATLLLIALGLVALGLWLWAQPVIFSLATNPTALLIIQVVLYLYAALWLVLTLDTLRLIRLAKTGLAPAAVITIVSLLLCLVPAGASVYAANFAGTHRELIQDLFSEEEAKIPLAGRYNILLLGGDAGAGRYGLRPDSLSVLSVDTETGQVTLIGIPRNLEQIPFSDGSPLWGEFPNGYDCGAECLISYLYTFASENPELYPSAEKLGSNPGIEATRDAVSAVTDLELHYYILVDMNGFVELIDAMGGVEVDVKTRVPIASHKDDDGNLLDLKGWIEEGKQRMDGKTALWFARSRVTTNDYDRMARQRQVQEAIIAQIDPETILTRYQDIAKVSRNIVKTDIPSALLARLVEVALKAKDKKINRLELVPPLIETWNPDYELIHQKVQESFIPPEPEPETVVIPGRN